MIAKIEDRNQDIVVYDDTCNLCQSSKTFIREHAGNQRFTFYGLATEQGRELLKEIGLPAGYNDSIVFIDRDGHVYSKSSAALQISRRMGGFWPVLFIFKWLLPTRLRDSVYDFVARHRKLWFGTHKHCEFTADQTRSKTANY